MDHKLEKMKTKQDGCKRIKTGWMLEDGIKTGYCASNSENGGLMLDQRMWNRRMQQNKIINMLYNYLTK